MNKPPKAFFRLFLWEIENCLNLPVLSLIVASAILAVLVQSTSITGFTHDYGDLYSGASTIFLILTLVTCTLFSHSFAGSFGRGDLKRMLSYPVKRWQIFVSKAFALNLVIFSIYASTYAMNLYINAISLLEPMFYVSLFTIFLQLLFVCAVSVGISMLAKSELMSIVISFLLVFGLDNAINFHGISTSMGRFRNIFGYFEQITHPGFHYASSVAVTFERFTGSIVFPLLTAVVVLGIVFVYFTRKMEID
ncbi:MAG: ABC transporter permease [Candidatus Bathyarchaeota archaeon]|uniref:ABC transporter permease n=1 Tax=Candidatus Bathycorpusculum sp. TaxID=2994959 RepID=UPI002820209A|nr:ABC transporter permease [Candidatus Termiticorpusculum sp.]MCL2257985.1 ABC transporter permease [Candidatus Termiticorpusculum sp.]MCL2291828.1 ABC transporter permease [Candidatus Termiticorpusculum sp.]